MLPRYFWQRIWREPDRDVWAWVALSLGVIGLMLNLLIPIAPTWDDPLTHYLDTALQFALPILLILYGLPELLPKTWRKAAGVLRLTGLVLAVVGFIVFIYLTYVLRDMPDY